MKYNLVPLKLRKLPDQGNFIAMETEIKVILTTQYVVIIQLFLDNCNNNDRTTTRFP